jgi:heme a synthase
MWTHRLALLLSAATLVLLAAGALVVGTGSSLAVPDWPLAYGQVFPPMVGGILFEHGHRLIASSVGLITVILAASLWLTEPRRWVAKLGLTAVGIVIAQGVLGGITVLLLLPKPISISHALLAQLFFATTVILAQVTAPGWEGLVAQRGSRRGGLRNAALVTALLVLITELLGALVRHNNAGLAIPDFPLAYGALVPPLTAFPVLIHFLHRVGALVTTGAAVWTLWRGHQDHRGEVALRGPALAMLAFLAVQVSLGAGVIWSQRELIITTAHLVNGALLLGSATLLTLRAWVIEVPANRAASRAMQPGEAR